MSKAERYIELVSDENGYLYDQHALKAVEIAREELIEKAAKWLSKLSNYNAEFIYPAYSGTIENFANSFKQAMKDE